MARLVRVRWSVWFGPVSLLGSEGHQFPEGCVVDWETKLTELSAQILIKGVGQRGDHECRPELFRLRAVLACAEAFFPLGIEPLQKGHEPLHRLSVPISILLRMLKELVSDGHERVEGVVLLCLGVVPGAAAGAVLPVSLV